jgi:hypothetical protein
VLLRNKSCCAKRAALGFLSAYISAAHSGIRRHQLIVSAKYPAIAKCASRCAAAMKTPLFGEERNARIGPSAYNRRRISLAPVSASLSALEHWP